MNASTITKYNKKKIPVLTKQAQKVFNEFIRLRDKQDGFFVCISCNTPKPLNQMHAGHYMAAGSYSATRFNEDNTNGQCEYCNFFLSGNVANYRLNLIKKIGLERVEMVEIYAKANRVNKSDRYTLIDVIVTYTEKIKQLQ